MMENEGKNGGEKVFCEIWKWIFMRKGVKVIEDTFCDDRRKLWREQHCFLILMEPY
jgi:hypothetical protein